jgi:hypothetical protein
MLQEEEEEGDSGDIKAGWMKRRPGKRISNEGRERGPDKS